MKKVSESQQSTEKGRPIRVLHVVTALNVGGIETYLLRVLSYVDRQQFNMDVCYESPEPGAYADRVRELGCGLFRIDGKRMFLGYVRRLAAVFRNGRYDAVCDYTGDFGGASMKAGYLAGVKRRIVFYRSSGIFHRQDPARMLYRRWVRGLVTRYATTILSNSLSNLHAFYPNRKPETGKYHVVPNGIDLEEFYPADSTTREETKSQLGLAERFVIGHVGGLKVVKNHALMLRVFDRFRKQRPDATLLLVGDGTLRHEIEREIIARNLTPCVILAGCRHDVARYMRAMDMFWFPSYVEGLPNAIIEAQASGLPIIASNVPSIVEHLPDNAKRYAIDLNSDEAWLEALASLAGDVCERRSQGQKNRENAVQNYSHKECIDQFLRYLI